MMKRCVDFAIHLKKQSLLDTATETNTKELFNLRDMVWLFKLNLRVYHF